jgi:hypothetical protein
VIGEMTIEAQVRAVGSGAFTYRADGKFVSADESQQIDWLWSGTVGIPVRTEVPVDLSQDVMNILAAIASAVAVPSTGSGLDAAGVRSAIGLASANLDAQLDNLPTVSELNARTLPSADLTAIKTQTDKFVFSTTGRVDAGVIDKTGFSLTQTFPSNFAALAITGGGAVTVGTVSDKTGYSLSSSQSFNLTGNITGNLSGSVGSVTGAVLLPTLPTDWISAAGLSAAAVTKIQNGLSTYAGGDTRAQRRYYPASPTRGRDYWTTSTQRLAAVQLTAGVTRRGQQRCSAESQGLHSWLPTTPPRTMRASRLSRQKQIRWSSPRQTDSTQPRSVCPPTRCSPTIPD